MYFLQIPNGLLEDIHAAEAIIQKGSVSWF